MGLQAIDCNRVARLKAIAYRSGAMADMVKDAAADTRVLLIQAPYPGRIMFDSLPTSLLYAVGPAIRAVPGAKDALGVLAPSSGGRVFEDQLRHILALASPEAVFVSTSTAAIEETQRIVRAVRHELGEAPLVVVGGPHEDTCTEKVAWRVPGVDLSVAGTGQGILEHLTLGLLVRKMSKHALLADTDNLSKAAVAHGGTARLSAPGGRSIELTAKRVGPKPRASMDRAVRFDVFGDASVIPAMLSRGCAYGQCTFCAESLSGGVSMLPEGITSVIGMADGDSHAAIYFQDSIFPRVPAVQLGLLPALRQLGIEWGCQVYLPMLSQAWCDELAEAGCTYVYTGLESGDPAILRAVGKQGLDDEKALERLYV